MQTGIGFSAAEWQLDEFIDVISYTQECLGLDVVAYTPYTLSKYVNAGQERMEGGRERGRAKLDVEFFSKLDKELAIINLDD